MKAAEGAPSKGASMNAFRTSLPGRIISLSIAFALLSGGLIPLFGLHAATWLPFTLLIPIVGCVVGTILSVNDHTWSAMALVVALPLLLWPYAMALMLICNRYQSMG